ncbi:hypothetical protein IGI80_003659 [Enterococcus sp. DIV1420a]
MEVVIFTFKFYVALVIFLLNCRFFYFQAEVVSVLRCERPWIVRLLMFMHLSILFGSACCVYLLFK